MVLGAKFMRGLELSTTANAAVFRNVQEISPDFTGLWLNRNLLANC